MRSSSQISLNPITYMRWKGEDAELQGWEGHMMTDAETGGMQLQAK